MEFNKYKHEHTESKGQRERRRRRREGAKQQVITSREPIVSTSSIKRHGFSKLRILLAYKKLLAAFVVVLILGGVTAFAVLVFPPAPYPEPAPSIQELLPQPLEEVNGQTLTDMPIDLQEVILREIRVGAPGLNPEGDEIVFSAGMDNVGNPKLSKVYLLNTETRIDYLIDEIVPENGDIMHLAVNADYMVWADSTREGACILKYMERASDTIRVIKECPLSVPKPRLSGSMVVFAERTADSQDKLYAYDLSSAESVTLAVFNDSHYGISSPDISGNGRIVFTAPDTSGDQTDNSVLMIVEGGTTTPYSPNMYAFGPRINDNAVCWIDENIGPNASLFLSVDMDVPILVEEDGIDGYAMGTNYVAYSKDDRVYAYFYERGERVLLSKEQQRVQLASVKNDMVAWFDVSRDDINRDLLYYTRIK